MARPHNFTRKMRAEIILRAAGKCEACGAVLKAGAVEVDHILPVALGGESVVTNGRALCKPCHSGKTASDVGMIRKADRQRDRASGALKSARPMAGKKSKAGAGVVDKWSGFAPDRENPWAADAIADGPLFAHCRYERAGADFD